MNKVAALEDDQCDYADWVNTLITVILNNNQLPTVFNSQSPAKHYDNQ
jgi:hypothetical protein